MWSPPSRLLLGAGPSPVHADVLEAMARPTIGHLDPAFAELMEAVAGQLRSVFGTANAATLPLSATGSGGMDALVVNFAEPGDRIVCGVNGLFGERMADALARAGAEVCRVEAEWGRAIETERLIAAVAAGERCDGLVVVHAETSTGVLQPLAGLAEACRARDALLLVDCVTSLGGVAVELDAHGIDAAFSGTQKCLGCPPGLAPFSVGERALAKLERRRERPRSWYFDLSLILGYWQADGGRAYHHTAPINMIYALEAALRRIHEEGTEERYERHLRAHAALRAAVRELGCERLAPDGEALPSLLCVRVPSEVDDEAAIREALLAGHGIEISGGLGPLAGRAWRLGVMGEGAWPEPQRRLVEALAAVLAVDGSGALAALEEGWATSP